MSTLKRLGSLFSNGPVSVKRASLLLAITALVSNVLGLLRNLIFYRLIAPAQLDIYYASFRIPDFLFNILIFGAISSAFVPLFSGMLAKDRKEDAIQFANQTFTWITVVFGVLAIVVTLAMAPIMHLIVHGFDQARFETAVTLSRILMLQSIFFAWSFTCGGYLNSFRRFTTPALAPLVYNTAIIIGAFVAAKTGIQAIVYAVVAGAVLHFAIQAWEVRRTGYRLKLDFRLSKDVRDLGKLMLPRSISQGMSQFVLIVFTSLASGLTAGSIAILSGMNDLQTTPTVILVNSLAAAIFPTLAATAATHNWEELNRLLQKAFRMSLFLLTPSLVLSYVLRAQIVRLYFSIGGASWELTNLAIATFVGYLVGIVPTAFVVLLSRVFYSLKNTRTPMLLAICSGAIGITWASVSITYFHGTVAQLALADSFVSLSQCILYLIILKRHVHVQLGIIKLLPQFIRYLSGSLLAGFSAWVTLYVVNQVFVATGSIGTRSIIGLGIQLIAGAVVGIMVVVAYSKATLKEEVAWLKTRRSTTTP